MTKYLSPSVAGFLLQKELDYLDGAVANPKRPFVSIVGGSKVRVAALAAGVFLTHCLIDVCRSACLNGQVNKWLPRAV